MNLPLEKLATGTVFTFKGMTLRKAGMGGPCDPTTNKAAPFSKKTEYGRACDLKIGGQWQTDSDIQVWVPDKAMVEVN